MTTWSPGQRSIKTEKLTRQQFGFVKQEEQKSIDSKHKFRCGGIRSKRHLERARIEGSHFSLVESSPPPNISSTSMSSFRIFKTPDNLSTSSSLVPDDTMEALRAECASKLVLSAASDNLLHICGLTTGGGKGSHRYWAWRSGRQWGRQEKIETITYYRRRPRRYKVFQRPFRVWIQPGDGVRYRCPEIERQVRKQNEGRNSFVVNIRVWPSEIALSGFVEARRGGKHWSERYSGRTRVDTHRNETRHTWWRTTHLSNVRHIVGHLFRNVWRILSTWYDTISINSATMFPFWIVTAEFMY